MASRIEIIKNYCSNKFVLDIGCVDHNSELEKDNLWLHKNIKSIAKEILGLDYLKNEVIKLNKKGYNVVESDAENFDLKKKFAVIVAGELIEHLLNPGLFLNSVKKHMDKKSKLILTTPNVFSIRRIIGSILKGPLKENKEHVAYYSNTTIKQLLNRNGFKIEKMYYLYSEDKNKIRLFIEKVISLIFRKELKSTLLLVAKLK